MTTINGHITRAVGTVLSAAIYNADHVNHVTNANTLNAAKMEGATPPVADGDIAVFSGTSGVILKTYGLPPLVANAALFTSIKQVATNAATGVVEHATDAEIRAATTGNLVVIASLLESASAPVALTDAATVAVDWDTFIYATLTIAANRALGTPTNGQIGTWRTIKVVGNDATPRTLTFSGYRGGQASLTDITSSKEYLLTLFAVTSTIAILKATQALP